MSVWIGMMNSAAMPGTAARAHPSRSVSGFRAEMNSGVAIAAARTIRPPTSRSQLNVPEPRTPLIPACRSRWMRLTPIAKIAAQPATLTKRATTLVPTGPNQPDRRPTQGSTASATNPARIRARSVALSGSADGLVRQLSHTTHAPAAAIAATPIQYPILRAIPASRTTSHTPPASQFSRSQPAGTWPASVRTASAQCRRSGGSSRAAPFSSRASADVSRPITGSRLPAGSAEATVALHAGTLPR